MLCQTINYFLYTICLEQTVGKSLGSLFEEAIQDLIKKYEKKKKE